MVIGGFVVVEVVDVVVASGVTLESENVPFPFFEILKVNVNIRPFPVIEMLGMIAGFFTPFFLQLASDSLLIITPSQTTSLKVQLIVLLPALTFPSRLTTL